MPTGPLAIWVAATAALPTPAAAALEDRDGVSKTETSVRLLESMHRDDPKNLEVAEAMLRARYFLAETPGVAVSDLYDRNAADGLEMLQRVSELPADDFSELVDQVQALPRSADSVLFWTTVSFGRQIRSMPLFKRPGAARTFRQALEALVDRSPEIFFGGPHRVLSKYLANSPGWLGGSKQLALEHARKALALAPDYAGNRVNLAQLGLDTHHEPAAILELHQAVDAPPDLQPHAGPEQLRAQARARRMLEQLPR